jgi:ABC-type Fe3+/spermidine/putrescine transport system ATPase subunit
MASTFSIDSDRPASAVREPGKAASRPFLQISNLVKEFDGVKAVDNVSVSIGMGEIFALLGSSGCGKSTLLRMLAGFESPTSGQIYLNGQDISAIPPYQRPINMMFQSYALFPHLSVWENIAFGLRREGMKKEEMHDRVAQMLALVQLSDYGKRKPHQLSGGQQQRVALARSLAKRPQLLLLDEPLAALDKKLRERTQLELVDIVEQVGVTCVLVTHDQEEAMTMASRIAVMSQGTIRQIGKPQEIYESPNCRFVADFIGSVNLFQGRVVVDETITWWSRPPSASSTSVTGSLARWEWKSPSRSARRKSPSAARRRQARTTRSEAKSRSWPIWAAIRSTTCALPVAPWSRPRSSMRPAMPTFTPGAATMCTPPGLTTPWSS